MMSLLLALDIGLAYDMRGSRDIALAYAWSKMKTCQDMSIESARKTNKTNDRGSNTQTTYWTRARRGPEICHVFIAQINSRLAGKQTYVALGFS